jgi:hypothetical protein
MLTVTYAGYWLAFGGSEELMYPFRQNAPLYQTVRRIENELTILCWISSVVIGLTSISLPVRFGSWFQRILSIPILLFWIVFGCTVAIQLTIYFGGR